MEADESLERKALRNTRALVDILEVDERTRARRQKRALLILAIVAVIPVVVAFLVEADHPKESVASEKRRDCRVDAWGARASERTEQLRAAHPDMPYREIAKRLKQEQDAFMESVKGACDDNPGKAKP